MDQQRPDPPFSDDCINQFRDLFSSWLPVDWSVRSEQPMCLAALNALGQKLQDPDRLLFDCLISGVSASTSDDPIRPSGVFWTKDTAPDLESPSLQLHRGNWKSSEDYPELTAELLQTEIDQGWIFEFEGDEAEASQQYPCGVGLGKLGIAFSDSRPPRLSRKQYL